MMAFSNCNYLQAISFSMNSNLRIIENMAFAESKINMIIIPRHVKKIGGKAFFKCDKLKDVQFEENSELEEIGIQSFESTIMTKISIPDSCIRICQEAFYNIKSLKEFNIQEGSKLQYLGNYAFFSSNLSKFIIAKNLECFDISCIRNNNNLNQIEVYEGNNRFKVVNNLLLHSSKKGSGVFDVLFYAYKNIQNTQIPANVRIIGSYAFEECNAFENITFEKNSLLESINQFAFYNSTIKKILLPYHLLHI